MSIFSGVFSDGRRRVMSSIGVLGIGSMLIALAGCAHKKVDEKDDIAKRIYHEKINQVLISKDEKEIIIVSGQYHYFIDVDEKLLKALKSSLHAKIMARFSRFSVSMQGALGGWLTLYTPDRLETVLGVKTLRELLRI